MTLAPFDIAVIGMGIESVSHLTLEALEVLAHCHTGFVVSMDQAEVDDFRKQVQARVGVSFIIPTLISLSFDYRKDDERRDNYKRGASSVLSAALAKSPVAFLTPGHPFVLDSVSSLIVHEARSRDLRVKVVDGISCLDAILSGLHMELAPGVQVLDAKSAVLMKVTLDPQVACLLLQPGLVETEYPVATEDEARMSWQLLGRYLSQYYSAESEAFAIRTSDRFSPELQIYCCQVGQLSERHHLFPSGASLLLPPRKAEKPTNH